MFISSPRTARQQRGFSLMELMVVIAILGILGTLVVTNVMPALMKSRVQKVKTDIKTIKAAIMLYYESNYRLPDSLEQLTQPDPKNFNKPYTQEGQELVDSWGNEYVYSRTSSSDYTLMSYGADGIPGGEGEDADIDDKSMSNKKE